MSPVSREPAVEARLVDAAIIGTGQAAPALATALSARGESVALFEGGLLGGSCVNVGCTPTKTLRKSARIAHLARRAGEFGVQVGEVRVDVAAALSRMRDVVTRSREGLGSWIGGAAHVSLVRAWARLDGRAHDRFVVRADAQEWHARRVYLNVGTAPALPPIPGLAESAPLTNESLLTLDVLPEALLVIGGSYIGLELGQIFQRLGSRVTILETAPVVAAREDEDVSARLTAMLEAEGVRVLAGVTVAEVARHASGVRAQVRDAQGRVEPVDGSHVLVATGRRPNTAALGLETVGVSTDAQGYIPVDGTLATNVAGIWALGDVNRRGAFTHTAWQDHEIVLANHTGGARTADGRRTTYAMFTDPPLGRIGLSMREARALQAQGRRFLSASIDMASVSRAKEEGETTGVLSVLVDAESERFAGVTMLGIGADEIVQVIGALMAADAPYQVLRDALPVHPTVTEFFPTLLGRLAPLDGADSGTRPA